MYFPILKNDSESSMVTPFYPSRHQSERHHYSEEADNDMSPLKRRSIQHEHSELKNQRWETKSNLNDWINCNPIEASSPMRHSKRELRTDSDAEESGHYLFMEEVSTSENSLGLSLSAKLYRDIKTPPTSAFDNFDQNRVAGESIISSELEAVRRSFLEDCSLSIANDHRVQKQKRETNAGHLNNETPGIGFLIGSSLLPQNLRSYRYYIQKDVSPIYKTTQRLEAEDKKNNIIGSDAELVPISTSFFLEKEPETLPIQPILPNWLTTKLPTSEKTNFKSIIPSTKTERDYFHGSEDRQTIQLTSDTSSSAGMESSQKRLSSGRFFEWIARLKKEHEERRLKRKGERQSVIQLTFQPRTKDK